MGNLCDQIIVIVSIPVNNTYIRYWPCVMFCKNRIVRNVRFNTGTNHMQYNAHRQPLLNTNHYKHSEVLIPLNQLISPLWKAKKILDVMFIWYLVYCWDRSIKPSQNLSNMYKLWNNKYHTEFVRDYFSLSYWKLQKSLNTGNRNLMTIAKKENEKCLHF